MTIERNRQVCALKCSMFWYKMNSVRYPNEIQNSWALSNLDFVFESRKSSNKMQYNAPCMFTTLEYAYAYAYRVVVSIYRCIYAKHATILKGHAFSGCFWSFWWQKTCLVCIVSSNLLYYFFFSPSCHSSSFNSFPVVCTKHSRSTCNQETNFDGAGNIGRAHFVKL